MKCLISTDDVINAKLSANCEPNNHSLTPVSAAPLGRFWQRQDSIPSATAAWRRARPNTMISYKFHTILFYSSGSSPFLSHTLCMQVCVCVYYMHLLFLTSSVPFARCTSISTYNASSFVSVSNLWCDSRATS